MKKSIIILGIICLLSITITVSADWSNSWEFDYEGEDEYPPQGPFEAYSTLTFGMKANVTGEPTFTAYSVLNFSCKANVTESPDNQTVTMKNPNPANHASNIPLTQATWNITIEDPEGDTFNWSIETGPDVGDASANDETNGSKQTSLTGLAVSTTYTVWVNATDAGNGTEVSNIYNFTTRDNFIPSPPSSFTATTASADKIDLSWDDNDDNRSVIEWNSAANWDRGDGTEIYNNTGTSYAHSSLDPDTTYYYQAWSYNGTDNTYSTTNSTASDTTDANTPPALAGETPSNTSSVVVTTASVNVTITDDNGDDFNWTIEVSNGDSDGANEASNGSKSCSLSALTYDTTYTWWVNVTDGFDSITAVYSFDTEANPMNVTVIGWTGVEETNFTVSGTLEVEGTDGTTCFIEVDDDPSFGSPDANQSQGIIAESGSFTDDITGLNPGTLYYVRTVCNDSYGWNISWNETHVLTKPNTPTSLTITPISGGFNVSWTHGSGYQKSALYVNNSTWIESRPEGTLIYLNADSYYHHIGLIDGTTYYYRVWEYVENLTYSQSHYSDGNESASEQYESTQIILKNPNPSNGATGVSVDQRTWNITAENPTGGTINWTIESSVGSNASNEDNNRSIQIEIDDGNLSYGMTYIIYVNATGEGMSNDTNESYTFTVENENTGPVFNTPGPPNESEGISTTQSAWTISITDPNGDAFNWSIEVSNGDSDSANEASNGTKQVSLTTPLAANTRFDVWVNATDGENATNASYWFRTGGNFTPYTTLTFGAKLDVTGNNPSVNSNYPVNESTDIVMYPTLIVNVTEPQGDKFNISWSTNATAWTAFNDSCDNGSYTQVATWANESDTTYWWTVHINDTGGHWTNHTFHFTTDTYTWTDWSEWWTFTYSTTSDTYISNPYPANESEGVERPPTNISAYCNGSAIDVYFYFYNMTPVVDQWNLFYSWPGDSSDRFEYDTSNGIPFPGTDTRFAWGNTQYQWRVCVDNGSGWTNASYWYNTTGSRYDVTNSGDVVSTDVTTAWSKRTGQATYDGIYDVDNGGDIVSTDMSLIWSHRTG